MQRWAHRLLNALSHVTGVVLLYVWVVFTLRQFPYSRPWSEMAGDFVVKNAQLALQALLRSLPALLAIVVIVIVTRWLSPAPPAEGQTAACGTTHRETPALRLQVSEYPVELLLDPIECSNERSGEHS